jgi:hypothetical protein
VYANIDGRVKSVPSMYFLRKSPYSEVARALLTLTLTRTSGDLTGCPVAVNRLFVVLSEMGR